MKAIIIVLFVALFSYVIWLSVNYRRYDPPKEMPHMQETDTASLFVGDTVYRVEVRE